MYIVDSCKCHPHQSSFVNKLWQFEIHKSFYFQNPCILRNHLFSISYPLIYWEFLSELGYHPAFHKYISMFYGILSRYLYYLIFYGFFLITFGLAFFQMFPASDDYPSTFEQMLLKMGTMLIGEIDMMDTPFYKSGRLRVIEFLFFTSFLILVVLVLQNLLNALAIKDTEDMLRVAEEHTLFNLMDSEPISINRIRENKEMLFKLVLFVQSIIL